MDPNTSAPGEIWDTGVFTTSKMEPNMPADDSRLHCAWARLTYMDTAGVVRVVEIPSGNKIDVTVTAKNADPEPFYAAGTEDELNAIPPGPLVEPRGPGVVLTITVNARGLHQGVDAVDALVRMYGRP